MIQDRVKCKEYDEDMRQLELWYRNHTVQNSNSSIMGPFILSENELHKSVLSVHNCMFCCLVKSKLIQSFSIVVCVSVP